MSASLTPFEKFIGNTVIGFIVGAAFIAVPFWAWGWFAHRSKACSAKCGEHWTYDDGCVCLEVVDER